LTLPGGFALALGSGGFNRVYWTVKTSWDTIPPMSENKKYILWLDLMRVISIFLVIIIHTSSPLYNDFNLPTLVWMAGNVYNSIARVSVPLLYMISGYLLLSRQESIRSFYVNRVRKVVVPLLIWSVIYLVWSNHGYVTYSPVNAIKALALTILKQPAYYHLWFVYVLLAIYLFVPVLRVFVHAADETTIRYFALIWFIFGPLLDFIEQRYLNFKISIDLGFFTEYIGYFYLGYVIGRFQFSRKVSIFAGLTYAALALYTMFITARLSAISGSYFDFFHNYLRLNMVIMTVCAFIWLKYLGENLGARFGEKAEKVMRHLSASTFGIYLIHVMILTFITRGTFGFQLNPLSGFPMIVIPALALLVFIISYAIVAILQRIPYVRAIVPS
jgi:surface polysaccharide O-acyltransferase-like enzyme